MYVTSEDSSGTAIVRGVDGIYVLELGDVAVVNDAIFLLTSEIE